MATSAHHLAPFCEGLTARKTGCSKGATVPEDAPRFCADHDPDAPPRPKRTVRSVRPVATSGPALGHAVPLYAEPTDRAEWKAARLAAGTIGASDVYRILYGDVLTYTLEQRGELERANLDDVREVQRGNDAEPFILEWAGARKPGWVYRHPEHACLSCTPDGVTADGTIIEAKFTAGWNRAQVERLAEHGVQAVWGYAPARWWVQCQVQHAVFGLPVEIAVMVGTDSLADSLAGRGPVEGDMLRIPVARDEAFISAMLATVPPFHAACIVGDYLPDPGPSDADLQAAMRDKTDRWLVEAGLVVEMPDLEPLVGRFVLDSEARKEAGKREEEAKRQIKAALVASKAEVLRCGPFEVRADRRGALNIKEARQ